MLILTKRWAQILRIGKLYEIHISILKSRKFCEPVDMTTKSYIPVFGGDMWQKANSKLKKTWFE